MAPCDWQDRKLGSIEDTPASISCWIFSREWKVVYFRFFSPKSIVIQSPFLKSKCLFLKFWVCQRNFLARNFFLSLSKKGLCFWSTNTWSPECSSKPCWNADFETSTLSEPKIPEPINLIQFTCGLLNQQILLYTYLHGNMSLKVSVCLPIKKPMFLKLWMCLPV